MTILPGTTDAVVVDWLGRGGIAQCAEAWALELHAAGRRVVLVSRTGRELGVNVPVVGTPDRRGGPLRTHAGLIARAAQLIRDHQPSVVVVQNYVIPRMELGVLRAARQAGSTVVFVVHDHQHHTRTSGTTSGLSSHLRLADHVVVHSQFVAEVLADRHGITAEVVPHPAPLGLLRHPAPATSLLPDDDRSTAVHVGVLTKAATKGTSLVVELARQGVQGWRFAFLGVGAPTVPGAVCVDRFLDPGELVDAVSRASVTLLPYRFASQSGVAVLGQLTGAVPIAARVGGLVDQIEHDRSGLLLDRDAPIDAWREVLSSLTPALLARLRRDARDAAWAQHDRFSEAVTRLVPGPAPELVPAR